MEEYNQHVMISMCRRNGLPGGRISILNEARNAKLVSHYLYPLETEQAFVLTISQRPGLASGTATQATRATT